MSAQDADFPKKESARKRTLADKAAVCNEFAKNHNEAYRFDKIPDTQRDRRGSYLFGRLDKHIVVVPRVLSNYAQGIPCEFNPLGVVFGNGFYQTCTAVSMIRLLQKLVLITTPEKFKYISTFDWGCGLSLPQIIMAIYFGNYGIHVGCDLQVKSFVLCNFFH